jgi:hypothetical protein
MCRHMHICMCACADPCNARFSAQVLCVLTAGGVPTRHKQSVFTHEFDGLHTRHLLESTDTNTHKHKQTRNVARQSTVRTHAVATPSTSSEEGASPPPPASCISVAINHLPRRSYMCTATGRRCACSASHVDVDQLTSFSYCRFVSLGTVWVPGYVPPGCY